MKDILKRDIGAFQNNLQQIGAALAQLRAERDRLDRRIKELEEAENNQQISLQYASALMDSLTKEENPGQDDEKKKEPASNNKPTNSRKSKPKPNPAPTPRTST